MGGALAIGQVQVGHGHGQSGRGKWAGHMVLPVTLHVDTVVNLTGKMGRFSEVKVGSLLSACVVESGGAEVEGKGRNNKQRGRQGENKKSEFLRYNNVTGRRGWGGAKEKGRRRK